MTIFVAGLAGGLIYLSLNFLLVRPMQRITQAMERFRADPEDPAARVVVSRRRDEIGRAERELDMMQTDLGRPAGQGPPGRPGRGGGQDQSRPAQHADQRPDGVRPPGRPGRS